MNNKRIKVNNHQQEKPILKLKPQFNILVVVASKYLVSIFAIILIASLIFSSEVEIISRKYVYLAIVAYFIYVIIMLVRTKIRNQKTSYLFFKDYLHILKNYGRQEEIIIPYDDIDDILFYQTYPERMINMGSLGVKIKSGSIFNRIIMLESVPELEKNIERISKFVHLG